MDSCDCARKTERGDEAKKLIHRLNRIEGQIRGIRSMVESDAYCVDVLTQVTAARAALDAFGRQMLEAHIKHCVMRDMKAGKTETADELIALLEKMMK